MILMAEEVAIHNVQVYLPAMFLIFTFVIGEVAMHNVQVCLPAILLIFTFIISSIHALLLCM